MVPSLRFYFIPDLVRAVSRAIDSLAERKPDALHFHEQIKNMYSWNDIAARTEKVYDNISSLEMPTLIERLRRYHCQLVSLVIRRVDFNIILVFASGE